jgi:hypothetical protein
MSHLVKVYRYALVHFNFLLQEEYALLVYSWDISFMINVNCKRNAIKSRTIFGELRRIRRAHPVTGSNI